MRLRMRFASYWKMLKAVIFDMDGLLIDTEPLWRSAEISCFGDVGLCLTEDMCKQTIGMRIQDTIAYWYGREPWQNPDFESLEKNIKAEVKHEIMSNGCALDGVYSILEFFNNKGVHMAVASSSPPDIISTVLSKLRITHYFSVIRSAQQEKRGKPYPDVYRNTLLKLRVPPQSCLAFEDSVTGLRSSRAADIKTVVVPESESYCDEGFLEADMKLTTLADFGDEELNILFK